MNGILIAVLIIFAIVTVIQSIKKGKINYNKRDALFTPAEQSFLRILNQVVNDDVAVFGKVRVADVLTPGKGLSSGNRQTALNKISKKHFDFILCKKKDLSFLCAIELNDRSHNLKSRVQRDLFLAEACRSANIPLISISAKASYDKGEIKQTIDAYLSGRKPSDVKNPVNKKCPQCDSPLVKKTARKGKNAGNQFWACSAFPKCRYTESI